MNEEELYVRIESYETRECVKFLLLPPVEWQAAYEALSPYLKSKLGDALFGLAIRAGEYIEQRQMPNDHGHAVEKQNKLIKKVRKVLGYSYPDRPLHF